MILKNRKPNRYKLQVSLNLVIPVYNEEQSIPFLIERLKKIFSKSSLKKNNVSKFLVIFVDDGSTDKTSYIIQKAIKNKFSAILYILSRNFGHQNAICAGLSNSESDITVILDGDLQDPPEEICKMLSLWRQGNDVIYAERKKRKEPIFLVLCYKFFYLLMTFIADFKVPRDSGDFCLLDRRVVLAINSLPERLRFLRGLRAWVGFKQVAHTYERDARSSGQSKYTLKRLYQLATDGLTSISIKPLSLMQFCAAFSALVGVMLGTYSLYKYVICSKQDELALWFVFNYFLMSFFSTFIFLSLYIMSAYISRMYLEVKQRPPFIIAKKIFSGNKIG